MATSSTLPPAVNETCTFSTAYKGLLCTLLATTAAGAVIENVVFCLIVYHNKKLHKQCNILLVSLSVSDICISLFVPTLEFNFTYYYPTWPLGSVWTNIYNCAWMFSVVSPFMTVTAITVERFYAIAKPHIYRSGVSSCFMWIVVALLWAYSIMWIIIMAASLKPAPEKLYVWNVPHNLYYSFLFIHIIIPLFAILFLYWKIAQAVKLSKRNIGIENLSASQNSELTLAKKVIVIIIFLFLVWMPVFVLEIFYTLDYSLCGAKKADVFSVWIACSNCCLNPIIYSFRNNEVNKYIKNPLRALKYICSGCCTFGEVITYDDHPYYGSSS